MLVLRHSLQGHLPRFAGQVVEGRNVQGRGNKALGAVNSFHLSVLAPQQIERALFGLVINPLTTSSTSFNILLLNIAKLLIQKIPSTSFKP